MTPPGAFGAASLFADGVGFRRAPRSSALCAVRFSAAPGGITTRNFGVPPFLKKWRHAPEGSAWSRVGVPFRALQHPHRQTDEVAPAWARFRPPPQQPCPTEHLHLEVLGRCGLLGLAFGSQSTRATVLTSAPR